MKGSKIISLFIDTSTNRFEMSLLIDTKARLITHENTKTVTEKSNLLINRLLMSENLKLEDIDCLYTLLGPGSNTGIRVGLTICKIIHTLNPKVKLYGINTLKLLNSDGVSLLSDRAGNFFIYDINKKKSEKINKNKIVEILSKYENIYYEDLDETCKQVIVENNLGDKAKPLNVIQEMINRKDLFDDYSSSSDKFLPIYEAKI